jgi:hypothetical protein
MNDEEWEVAEDLVSSLEPQDTNPLDQPATYNPLNHAYPMLISTAEGKIEIMVQFMLIQGKANLPTEWISDSPEFQVPVSVEDMSVTTDPDDDRKEELQEQLLVDELTQDQRYYMIPTIVRARRLIGPEKENELGAEGGDLMTKEEVAELVPPNLLLARLRQYRDEVAQDEHAPDGLLDLLNHFSSNSGLFGEDNEDDHIDSDDEWEDDEED